ncbi:MAG: LysR family transcriptional regulator [Acidobacteriaceae bacterium]
MDFSSRQLRAFLLVAQHGSFARASEALFITPSGLSLLVRELETQLGFRLFDRTTRHVALTPDGNKLLPIARRNLQELDAAMGGIRETSKQARLSVSVGAPALVAANIMPQAIKEFRTHRPDVRISISDANLTEILHEVESGTLDLGVGIFPKVPGIRRTPLFRFSLMVIQPQTEFSPQRVSMPWSALKGESLIALRSGSPLQRLIDQHLSHAGIVSEASMVLNALDTQIAMVEAGAGIAIIPSFGLPACRNRRITMCRLIQPIVTADFHQITNRAKKPSTCAEDFAAFLQSHIARWAGRTGIF